jgi:dTDP-4-dehydrorhamnose reductase
MTSILLLGASGQVGTAIAKHLDQVIAPTRDEFDLANATPNIVEQLIDKTRPDVLINCAAYTAVDRAEDEQILADQVNGHAVGLLARVTYEAGVRFVTYSTDYVFDGTDPGSYFESSPTNPVNAYGRSKLRGEHLALDANPASLVIRTSWVISGTHPNFVATVLRLVESGKPLTVVNDQHGCPTIADDLARLTLDALEVEASGILHVSNQGPTTWFDLARTAVELAGKDPERVKPCSTSEYPTRAPRPSNSVLGSERLGDLGINPLPHWTESLPGVVEALLTD